MYNGTTLTTAGNAIFEAIWSNSGLRGSLFPIKQNDNQKLEAKYDFIQNISSTANTLINFSENKSIFVDKCQNQK